MVDIDLHTPVELSRREALRQVRTHLGAVYHYGLDQMDNIDADHIRQAYRLLCLALKEGGA